MSQYVDVNDGRRLIRLDIERLHLFPAAKLVSADKCSCCRGGFENGEVVFVAWYQQRDMIMLHWKCFSERSATPTAEDIDDFS